MKLDELLLAPQTRILLGSIIHSSHHALLIHGVQGVGLRTVALGLAEVMGVKKHSSIELAPESFDKEIPVARIRELYAQTKSSRDSKLLVLIDDADMMSLAAQNTLLKLLEEPPREVLFMLTSHDMYRLLPTIRSRVMDVPIHEVSSKVSNAFIAEQSVSGTKQAQIAFLAGGRPAKLQKLIDDNDYFDLQVATVKDAKSIATGDAYTKLSVLTHYTKDRRAALQITTTLGTLYSHNMLTQHKSKPQALGLIADTIDELRANANPKIALLRLAVEL